MAATQIDREAWAPFLETIEGSLVGKQAEIEVVSLRLGDQVQAEWIPLIGIAYDRKNHLIEIALDNLDHLVTSPRELFVDYGVGESIAALEIIEEDGTRQIVKFKEALLLPAPSDQGLSTAPR